MNRCLRILTAVVVMTLPASPVEGNDDLNTSLPWRRAVLAALQAVSLDESRTAPKAPPPAFVRRQPTPVPGSGRGPVEWGAHFEVRSFNFDNVDIDSSTGTLTVFQGGQQVNREAIDNTASLRSSSRYAVSGEMAEVGVWLRWNRPQEDRISAEVSGGLLIGDPEIEREGVTLNMKTKTGNEVGSGGWFEARFQFEPEADDRFFGYVEASLGWIDVNAKRDPPELISGATIELDTSEVSFWELMAGGGVGFFLDADRKYTITTGIAAHRLNASIERTLHFSFPAFNQRQESESLIELKTSPVAFNASAEALVTSYLYMAAGVSLARKFWSVYAGARVKF